MGLAGIVACVVMTSMVNAAFSTNRDSSVRPLPIDSSISLELQKSPTLTAILRLASEQKAPLGIIYGASPALCSAPKRISIRASNLEEAFSQVLTGTGYKVSVENGVYIISAPDVTDKERNVLNFRFDRFSATDSTMSESGKLLKGYIATVVGGSGGFVLNTLSNDSSERIDVHLRNSSTKEIADHIVSLKGKGLWIFGPPSFPETATGSETPLQIYSYTEDSKAIDHLGCNIAPQQ